MKPPGTQRRTRARLAIAACFLWVAGVEALPGLHQLLHDQLAPHHHGAADALAQRARSRPSEDAPGERDLSRDPRHHAAGSLAHRDAALQPAPPPLLEPLPVDRQVSYVVDEVRLPSLRLALVEPNARGPPMGSRAATP